MLSKDRDLDSDLDFRDVSRLYRNNDIRLGLSSYAITDACKLNSVFPRGLFVSLEVHYYQRSFHSITLVLHCHAVTMAVLSFGA